MRSTIPDRLSADDTDAVEQGNANVVDLRGLIYHFSLSDLCARVCSNMEITGKHLIGDTVGAVGQETFQAFDPSTQAALEPAFHEATVAEAGMALRLAQEAFDPFRSKSPEERAQFLDTIADEIMALGDALLERAHQETGLPLARLTGERGRAVNPVS